MANFFILNPFLNYYAWQLWTDTFFSNFNIIFILNKNNANEPFLNLYYEFWNSTLYMLPILGWLIFVKFFIKIAIKSVALITPLSFVLFWMYYNTLTTASLNFFEFGANPFLFKLNNLLLNSLNKYHPFLFFTAFLFFLNYESLAKPHFTRFLLAQSPHITFNFRLHFFIALAALFTGSWWALQEETWGGWWNWDSSELLALFVLSAYALQSHFASCRKQQLLSYRMLQMKRILLISYYFFLQFNLKTTSHNFGLTFFFFFETRLFLIICGIMTMLINCKFANFLYNLQKNLIIFTTLAKDSSTFFKTWALTISSIGIAITSLNNFDDLVQNTRFLFIFMQQPVYEILQFFFLLLLFIAYLQKFYRNVYLLLLAFSPTTLITLNVRFRYLSSYAQHLGIILFFAICAQDLFTNWNQNFFSKIKILIDESLFFNFQVSVYCTKNFQNLLAPAQSIFIGHTIRPFFEFRCSSEFLYALSNRSYFDNFIHLKLETLFSTTLVQLIFWFVVFWMLKYKNSFSTSL